MGRLAHKRGVPAPQIVKIEEKYGMRYYTFMARLIAEPPLPAQVLFKEEEEVTKEKVSVEVSTHFVCVVLASVSNTLSNFQSRCVDF